MSDSFWIKRPDISKGKRAADDGLIRSRGEVVETDNGFIIDFDEEKCSIQYFPGRDDQAAFCQAIRVVPDKIRTRMIVIESTGSRPRNVPKEAIDSTLDWSWPKILSAPLTDALGSTYQIEPLFFNLMAGAKEIAEITNALQLRDRSPQFGWEMDYPIFDFESHRTSTMMVGFNHGRAYTFLREGPRLWMTIAQPPGDSGVKVGKNPIERICLSIRED